MGYSSRMVSQDREMQGWAICISESRNETEKKNNSGYHERYHWFLLVETLWYIDKNEGWRIRFESGDSIFLLSRKKVGTSMLEAP